MALFGGAQVAVGTALVGRLGWLAVAENDKYQLMSENNRVQLIVVPPRRGWMVDRNGTPSTVAIFESTSSRSSSRIRSRR